MKEFSRGFALQANAPQVSLFQILAKDTVAAKDKVEDLVLHPEKTKDQADILAYVVENALDESHDFLKGLSDAQKSGLKAWKKNVEKADSDVDKCWKTLNQVLVRQKTDDKRIGSDAEKLGKALENLETEQWNLARKMGIQPPPAEGDQRS
jgi:hypothetical protein